ncbi:uncharacterized protein MONBRDRAFT_29556 [Monosiga brevicollis MX1]|uniref:Uncharacterized protein n=1 Tax=Monosiga brevicollis TaxID=81824 RepID=A9VBF7_MONBE|nr:uncharacterized protein MONBRDRAFT_29556 [Monosiga brevicollis MX1]EDQ85230.1 predicted protein [Monosiga brevicollis MX1]|eukprot:XP_001750055.1 hypothetical protein [Monosiga brevicollis MX1]
MLVSSELPIGFAEALLAIAATISVESLSDIDDEEEGNDESAFEILQVKFGYFGWACSTFFLILLLRRFSLYVFRFIPKANEGIQALNCAELCFICLLPFASSLGSSIRTLQDSKVSASMILGALLCIQITRLLLLHHAARHNLWSEPEDEDGQEADETEANNSTGLVETSGNGSLVHGSERQPLNQIDGAMSSPMASDAGIDSAARRRAAVELEYTICVRRVLFQAVLVLVLFGLAIVFGSLALLGLLPLFLMDRITRQVGLIPASHFERVNFDKKRYELFRDAVYSIIGSILALSLDSDQFFAAHHGALKQVSVLMAYFISFYIAASFYLNNVALVAHLKSLHGAVVPS